MIDAKFWRYFEKVEDRLFSDGGEYYGRCKDLRDAQLFEACVEGNESAKMLVWLMNLKPALQGEMGYSRTQYGQWMKLAKQIATEIMSKAEYEQFMKREFSKQEFSLKQLLKA